MKQTAVEWLVNKMPTAFKNLEINKQLIQQAKEMEKQQIIEATIYGNRQEFYDGTEMIAKQYYNEQFKNKQDEPAR